MRLHLAGAAAPPITVGYFGTFNNNAFSARVAIDLSGPASGAGIITSVDVNAIATVANAIRIMTGTIAGSLFTVTAVSGPLTAPSGAATHAVSLAIAAGGYIGYWASATTTGLNYTSGPGDMGYATTPSTAPTVGQQFGFSTAASFGRYCIHGTG